MLVELALELRLELARFFPLSTYASAVRQVMAHGHEPQPIPVVEYKLVDPSVLVAPDVHNNSAAFYGFNDGKEWTGGKENDHDTRYIRYLREYSSSSGLQRSAEDERRAGLFCRTREAVRRV